MVGIIGDLHLKEKLGYADYLPDQRKGEKQLILEYIKTIFDKCHTVVFMGDQLNSRNNTSEVIREFVNFVEGFHDKEVYVLAGNHEKKADGKTAVDFMKEIDKPNWHIITNEIFSLVDDKNKFSADFCPYFYRAELGKETNEDANKALMKKLKGADYLFHHHAITETKTESGTPTSIFDEVVLSRKALEEKYKVVVGGHIHKPQQVGNSVVTGSIFNNEVGEHEKFIWLLDEKTGKITQKKLPGRGIYKLVDPTDKEVEELSNDSILKVELTKKRKVAELENLKEKLREKFDAFVLLENYPSERKKVHFEEGMLDFSIVNLLTEFAKQQKIPEEKLLKAWELIQ